MVSAPPPRFRGDGEGLGRNCARQPRASGKAQSTTNAALLVNVPLLAILRLRSAMTDGPDTPVALLEGLVALFGIESPGLTASLAIADHVVEVSRTG